MVEYIRQCCSLNSSHPFSFSCCIYKFFLCICVSIPALQYKAAIWHREPSSALWQPRGVWRRLKRMDIYKYTYTDTHKRLIHVVVWQKQTQHCKTIVFRWTTKKRKICLFFHLSVGRSLPYSFHPWHLILCGCFWKSFTHFLQTLWFHFQSLVFDEGNK